MGHPPTYITSRVAARPKTKEGRPKAPPFAELRKGWGTHPPTRPGGIGKDEKRNKTERQKGKMKEEQKPQPLLNCAKDWAPTHPRPYLTLGVGHPSGSARARTICLRSSKGADGRGYIIRLLNRGINAGGAGGSGDRGGRVARARGASALTVRWSLYIGYLEVANRVETLILNGGLYGLGRGIPVRLRLGQSLDCKDRGKQQIPRSARDDNATVGRGDFRLGTRCGGAL